jgi:coenzyme F420-0:L-glutamate ligase / coenzyme F420-1:gamma-L-glutamate ligase
MRAPRTAREVSLIPVVLDSEVRPGDDTVALLLSAMRKQRNDLRRGDILVVKHKIISKAEGRVVRLAAVKPSVSARTWARKHGLDARVAQLALDESRRVVRQKRGVLITETRHGFICANSGVDVSNVDGGASAVLLPTDPDASAEKIRRGIRQKTRLSIPVIVTDSFGRPWREGLCEVAIGVAGLEPLHDYRGLRDQQGYPLHATVEAVADELACAAGLVCGKLSRTPACIIRGFLYRPGRGKARQLLRPAKLDLFR